jgi:hypothetical protein
LDRELPTASCPADRNSVLAQRSGLVLPQEAPLLQARGSQPVALASPVVRSWAERVELPRSQAEQQVLIALEA